MNPVVSPTSSGRLETMLPWLLRTGVGMCFIGHGCYGIMTKAAWVPYFAVAGIGEPTAWRLMPWIGAMDITMGLLAFVWPCRALFVWAGAWCIWTALLRPLAGQGWSEFFERAGNYGVPIAGLVAAAGLRGWLVRLPEVWPASAGPWLERVLRVTTFSLLIGHAGCALLLKKAALAHNYALFGLADPATMMMWVGGFELVLAFAALALSSSWLFVGICFWKLATEALFLTSGAPAPFFDFVEHGGSYAAPLALGWLLTRPAIARPSFSAVLTHT